MPIFLWDYTIDVYNFYSLFMRFVAAGLCFMLVIKDFWSPKFKKFLPLYWHFTLTLCLPFFTTYMMLENGLTNLWLINMALALFILASLLDWLTFIISLTIGSSLAYLNFISINHTPTLLINIHNTYSAIYIFIFSVLIAGIFSRNKEFIQQKVVNLLEKKVQLRTNHLLEALRAKKEFLNNISHEIRTPLQGILGIASSLNEQWRDLNDEEKHRYVAHIDKNSDRLMKLLSNLLDLAKYEAGKMHCDMKENNIIKILKEVVDEVEALSLLKGITIHLNIMFPQTELFVFCDQERIKQVIRNLLSNAISYSENNEIIEIIVTIKDQNIIFQIKDNGIGIPENELKKIFNPFEQSKRTKTGAGGTGLGLAIANEIVSAHKGKIWAENNKNKGASFYFMIPIPRLSLQQNTDKELLKDTLSYDKPSLTKTEKKKHLNVLLVDDEQPCLVSGSLILTGLGHKVITISSGKEAINYLKSNNAIIPDIILLDIMMPDIYGLNVLKELKEDKNLHEIPVIIQSGLSDQKELEKAYKLGAEGFIPKPYNKETLNKVLENMNKKLDI